MIQVKNIEIGKDKVLLHTEKGDGYYLFSNSLPLKNASLSQRLNFTISPFGVHWAELDEDLCFDGFVFERSVNDRIRYNPNLIRV